MSNPDVVVIQRDDAFYPDDWNPSCEYPEYLFPKSISQGVNSVYSMVRECLRDLGLDAEHYGTRLWNPLGDLVAPGKTIVIKPNWVLHVNKGVSNNKAGMECLVTHPSVIRAICDYCLIALKGEGKIVIGDAPVQDCDLDCLFERMGYDRILSFYRGQGVEIISIEDFRAYRTHMNKFKVIDGKVDNAEGVEIDLGELSAQRSDLGGHYVQVANYDRRETTSFHSNGRHIYSVSRPALEADLIISLPKPKSHRFAGMTGAMKNLVGIACKKETLPHRTSGDLLSGGDSYCSKSLLKDLADFGLNRKTYLEHEGKTIRATLTWLWTGFACLLAKKLAPDPYLLGSWYGNDTIWRTIVDLVFIMTFADTCGDICEMPQRRFLTIADGIVAGEGAGPLRPTPKKLGALVAGLDFAQVDAVICKMMGFPAGRIPLMREVMGGCTRVEYREPIVLFDDGVEVGSKACIAHLEDCDFPADFHFEPHPNWKDLPCSR